MKWKGWGEGNPTSKDILSQLADEYGTAARWMKAVQHLRERGQIEDSPRDIERLMGEAPDDIRAECEADIKDALMRYAWPHLRRMVVKGLPQWYKEQLLKRQFSENA